MSAKYGSDPLPWHSEDPGGFQGADLVADTVLDPVSCVASVSFPQVDTDMGREYGISLPAQMVILSACAGSGTLESVELDCEHYEIAQELAGHTRGQQASALRLLPTSVKVLDVRWYEQPDWVHGFHDNEISDLSLQWEPDPLSQTLGILSMQLRMLTIEWLGISEELFLAFERASNKTPWPDLETFKVTKIPMYSRKLEPLIYVRGVESNPYETELVSAASYFDRLFVSAGKAAQKMPRLKFMLVEFDVWPRSNTLKLCEGDGDARELNIWSAYKYRPAQSVVDAWKAPGGGFEEVKEEAEYEAFFPRWPPH